MTSVQQQFEAAAKHFETVVAQTTDKDKLSMYAFWNQATNGDVDVKTEPSRMDVRAWYKFQARKKIRGMTKEQAMKNYVAQMKKIDPTWRPAGATSDADMEEDEDDDVLDGSVPGKKASIYAGAGANKTEIEKVKPTFDRAVEFARLSGLFRNEATRSQLYAYYKQSTHGPCTKPAPGMLAGRKTYARWRAWSNLFDMKPEEAMRKYVELVKKVAPEFESKDPAYFTQQEATPRKSIMGQKSSPAASPAIPRPSNIGEVLSAIDKIKSTNSGTVYLITGATGFIGKRLVRRIVDKYGPDNLILCVARTPAKVEDLFAHDSCVVGLKGDISQPSMGLDKDFIKGIQSRGPGTVHHMFHCAALYDMKATEAANELNNVQGTKEATTFCNLLGPQTTMHYVSSIAVAGNFDGIFNEDMFQEGQTFDAPYLETKFRAEKVVREECKVPYRIYRPGLVVGSSETGEMDKIDGPYYLFKPLQRLKRVVPSIITLPCVQGEVMPIVPVDYVVNAMVHIAHKKGLDKRVFHLVDPDPPVFVDMLNIFADAAGAPSFSSRVPEMLMAALPRKAMAAIQDIPIIADAPNSVGAVVLGVPDSVMRYLWSTTTFDTSGTQEALRGSGIKCLPLKEYGYKLWDYYARHLDPAIDRFGSLSNEVRDKVVVVTGSSDGIGEVLAKRLGQAGAKVVLVARSKEKLEVVQKDIVSKGGKAFIQVADLADGPSTYKAASEILKTHGGVDILVNNAGRSIRRSVEYQCEENRFHDFTRTMDLNAYGALRMTLSFLPGMRQRKNGQVVNVSSIGVMTGPARFGAYVASKSYLDAFSRCISGEVAQDGVVLSTAYIPLTRTKMVVSKDNKYDHVKLYTPEQSAGLIERAITTKERKVMTPTAWWVSVAYFFLPSAVDGVMSRIYALEPEAPPGDWKGPVSTKASGDKDQLKRIGHLVSGAL